MRFRIWFSFLCLFGLIAAPLLASADSTVVPVLRTGSLEIALDPDAASDLPIDSAELRLNLCTGLLHVNGIGTISPRGECDLVVSPPPRLGLFLHDFRAAGSGSWRISLQAVPERSGLWKSEASVTTSCGLWDVSMVLDPDKTQPISELALEPSAADPAQGTFAGALKLAVRYRFLNRTGGTAAIELPATVSLDLSGHWMAVPEGGPGLEDSASNLVLFAGVFGGAAAGVPTCVTWGGMRCEVCVEPVPEVLDALRPGFNP